MMKAPKLPRTKVMMTCAAIVQYLCQSMLYSAPTLFFFSERLGLALTFSGALLFSANLQLALPLWVLGFPECYALLRRVE